MVSLFLVLALLAAPPPEVILSGLVSTQDEKTGAAVLMSAGKTRVAAMGESAFGGQVTAIDAQGVELLFGTERVRLRLTKTTSTGRSLSPASTPAAAQETARSAAPPQAAPALTLSRADVDRRLTVELDRILAETALAPVTEDGRVVGVALRRIAQGSLLTEVGLRTGDVITELNGTPIDGISALMALYGRLQSASELKAVVLREGQPVTLNLKLK